MRRGRLVFRPVLFSALAVGAALVVAGSAILKVSAQGVGAAQNPVAATGSSIAGTSGSTVSSGGQNPAAQDPGPRTGPPGAGQPLPGLTADELQFFQDGQTRFVTVDSVSGTQPGFPNGGLGPTFNSNSCGSCHAQPVTGGTSPAVNPQIAAASDYGASNSIPSFISSGGPVREARFPYLLNSSGALSSTPDGGVHDLFTIEGREDAPGCSMAQPDFAQMLELGNIIFRIPTPVFGAGLLENIPDTTIYANMAANSSLKQSLGISGLPNTSGNDGTITKFGWKAQNKSLEVFAGEAYNVEIGVTNELFTNERGLPPAACLFNPTPEDTINFTASGSAILSDVVAFAAFMRFLAPPAQSVQGIPGNPSPQSIAAGQTIFSQIHCDMCHTPSMQTSPSAFSPALNNQTAELFSDLLVHHMGSGLADNVTQGSAGPDEFRTAPLWGLGQRLFFLHDGRATPANGGLLTAIQAHSSQGSEANAVISLFQQLSNQQKQELLNFLRSL